MLTASLSSFGEGTCIPLLSHTVTRVSSANFHSLCVPHSITECDNLVMSSDKNGGPNYLRAWRIFRGLTQEQLADLVDTNANMIQYLETGERGLSAKWLRRLAPALDTTPGMILDHDPDELDADILDIWTHADRRTKRQISEIAKTILRTGTND
jgi:transcriptional regulator with XRE-family HTH domain